MVAAAPMPTLNSPAVALLAAGSLSFAAAAVKQDSVVAAEYKSEAKQLLEKAEQHHKP
jgi:hypothetical protein